jgi:hypothetical protein
MQFTNGFLKSLSGFKTGFRKSFRTTAAAFQSGGRQSECPKGMESC